MKKLMSSSLMLGVCVLAAWNATGQTEPKKGLIVPGTSVAGVKLGDDASSFEAVFPKRPASNDHSLTGGSGEQCPTEIYYWSDLDLHTTVVTAYLKGGEISQLSVQGPRFSLPKGIDTRTTEEQVKEAYPKGQEYVLIGSASRLNGGRNLAYWVDEEAGVAFKLAWWQSKNQRSVSGIDIFPKGAAYRPDGCISPPQQWKKLK